MRSYCLSAEVIKMALRKMIVAALLRLDMAEPRSFDLMLPKLPGAQVLGMEGV